MATPAKRAQLESDKTFHYGEVTIDTNYEPKTGIFSKVVMKCETPIGWDDMLKQLKTDNELKTSDKETIILHTSFKSALTTQLSSLRPCLFYACLYHGVPNIGKSTLALATCYYLAKAHGEAISIRFKDDHHKSPSTLVKYVRGIISVKQWIVLDQMNTNIIRLSILKELMGVDGPIQTMTFFTSGHFMPPESWCKHKTVCYRVIDIALEKEDLIPLFGRHATDVDDLTNAHYDSIYGLTKNYGILKDLAEDLTSEVNRNSEINYSELVYPIKKLERNLELLNSIFILWSDFFRVQSGTVSEDNIVVTKFAISSDQMSYLSRELSGKHLDHDDLLLVVISWFSLLDMAEMKETVGYRGLEDGKYCYCITNKTTLVNLLNLGQRVYTPEKALDLYKVVYFHLYNEGNTNDNFTRGGLFEKYIKVFTGVQQPTGNTTGIFCNRDKTASVEEVEFRYEISSVEGMLDAIPCDANRKCHLPHDFCMWVILNKSGEASFKGFDFAFIRVRHKSRDKYTIVALQLFDATIGPDKKTNIAMNESFVKVANSIVRRRFEETSPLCMEAFLLVPKDMDDIAGTCKFQLHTHSKLYDVRIVHVDDYGFLL